MELWKEIEKLKGETLQTLRDGKRFDVLDVNVEVVIIRPHASMKERPVKRSEIEGAFKELSALGHISRAKIEERHSPRNPAYVASILSTLPGVKYTLSPIILPFAE